MNQIKIIVGDQWGDGHGYFTEISYNCNLNKDEIEESYKKGSEIIGFELTKDCCKNYEEDTISSSYLERINDLIPDFKFDYINEIEDDLDDSIRISSIDFVNLYLEICKLGNPNIIFEKISIPYINIGGYGTFID